MPARRTQKLGFDGLQILTSVPQIAAAVLVRGLMSCIGGITLTGKKQDNSCPVSLCAQNISHVLAGNRTGVSG